MVEEYWPIYRINFNRHQMLWLINHLQELHNGQYPPEPGSSGYDIEMPLNRKARRYKEPAQNKVLELAAEVECRLNLVMDYISGWPRPTKKIRRKRNNPQG